MKKISFYSVALVLLCTLSACSHKDLTAPCPDYGRRCSQIPINNFEIPNNLKTTEIYK